MTVYVDNVRLPLGRMKMSHLLADTVDELHYFAGRLGLKREWFQSKSTPHYDVCAEKREQALKLGAREASRRKVVELIRSYRYRTIATWSISLNVNCPKCEERFDALETEDFWDGRNLEFGARGADAGLQSVNCPKCETEITMVLEY